MCALPSELSIYKISIDLPCFLARVTLVLNQRSRTSLVLSSFINARRFCSRSSFPSENLAPRCANNLVVTNSSSRVWSQKPSFSSWSPVLQFTPGSQMWRRLNKHLWMPRWLIKISADMISLSMFKDLLQMMRMPFFQTISVHNPQITSFTGAKEASNLWAATVGSHWTTLWKRGYGFSRTRCAALLLCISIHLKTLQMLPEIRYELFGPNSNRKFYT